MPETHTMLSVSYISVMLGEKKKLCLKEDEGRKNKSKPGLRLV